MQLPAAADTKRNSPRSGVVAQAPANGRERLLTAVAAVVCTAAVLISAAIVWLSFTDPLAVAQITSDRALTSLLRLAAGVLVSAVAHVVRLL